MRILVIFASHRFGGVNAEIEKMILSESSKFDFDFVHMADHKIEGCTSCHECANSKDCVLPESDSDRFHELFDKMIEADAIFVISPVYASIPSRLTALLERLTSLLYDTGLMNTDENPLLNKPAAVFCYCSCGICDDSALKLIFDKLFMKNYRFDRSTYQYLNDLLNPEKDCKDIASYVMYALNKL